jgi:hypothetical protein
VDFIHNILEYSEIWGLLISLSFIIIYGVKLRYLKPIAGYVILALLVNIAIVGIYFINQPFYPEYKYSNNFLYNVHSLVRFYGFTIFFILLNQPFLKKLKWVTVVIFSMLFLVNFLFFEDFFNFRSFSGRLLSAEAGLLLLFCLQYYFYILRDETDTGTRPPSFWVVTGLSIYVVVNFPIFLFYQSMLKQFEDFAIGIWDVHNISYVIFCIFLARAF